jgi:hypothetical protein
VYESFKGGIVKERIHVKVLKGESKIFKREDRK